MFKKTAGVWCTDGTAGCRLVGPTITYADGVHIRRRLGGYADGPKRRRRYADGRRRRIYTPTAFWSTPTVSGRRRLVGFP